MLGESLFVEVVGLCLPVTVPRRLPAVPPCHWEALFSICCSHTLRQDRWETNPRPCPLQKLIMTRAKKGDSIPSKRGQTMFVGSPASGTEPLLLWVRILPVAPELSPAPEDSED